MRFLGAREILAGVGILTQPKPAAWLWSRVAGDIMDLSLLGAALGSDDSEKERVTAATAAVIGVTVLDVMAAREQTRQAEARQGECRVVQTITIDRAPEECYALWHDFPSHPRFMDYLESVEFTTPGRSHWRARGPAGTTLEWDAEVSQDQPGRCIAWHSLENADLEHSGNVRFERAPGNRGTLVRLEMHYAPPGGTVGATLANLLGAVPQVLLGNTLRHFKQILETGEIAKSDASIHTGMHAAQPPSEIPQEMDVDSRQHALQPQYR